MQRIYLPKNNGPQRPLSIPTLDDRARQAVYLQALQPIAETTAAPDSSGVRPKRRGADAIDHGCTILRQTTSAPGILEGDLQGVCDTMELAGLEAHLPMPKRLLSTWLRRGFVARGARLATTAGVPHGGILSPVIGTRGLDGLAAVVQGGNGHRRGHHINAVRGADDFIVTANAREVFEETVLPRINAVLAARGVRRSPTKPVIPPISQGFACVGQTLRKYERPQGKPATLQIPPSQASKAKGKVLCKHRAGSTPAQLIGPLNPVLRGGAN